MAAAESDTNQEGHKPQRDAWPEKPCGLWQWEHRSGFKDYDEITCERIEKAYQRGEPYVRLKTGKMKQTPMELFFVDMIQHDPITGNRRRIRRTGRESCCKWVCRKLGEMVYCIETGRKYRMRFEQYIEARRELLKDLDKQDYSEVDLYWDTGCCARIARNGVFIGLTGLMVFLNTLWLGFDANFNKAATIWQADVGFQLVEISFSIVFFLEMVVRFGALRRKRDFIRDLWFLFDFVLVSIMVGENVVMLLIYLMSKDRASGTVSVGDMSILRLARLIRLTRLTRVGRLLRFTPEVLTMLKGITLALRSVFVTTVLLVALVYLFGIIFTIGSKSYPGILMFPRVDDAMWVLLLQGTFLDEVAGNVVYPMWPESYILTLLFVVFILLSNITLLNMLVGILCEVAVNVSKREKEESAVGYLKNNLLEILEVHDKNDDRHINKDDFELLMRNPEMHMILTNFGVDTEDLVSLKGILFEGKTVKTVMAEKLPTGDLDESNMGGQQLGTVSKVFPAETKRLRFAEFLEVVLRLRGGNGASVRDIVDLREYLRQRMDHLELQLPNPNQPPLQTGDSQTLRMAGVAESFGPPSPSESAWPDISEVLLGKLAELREDLQTMNGQIQRLEFAKEAAGIKPGDIEG